MAAKKVKSKAKAKGSNLKPESVVKKSVNKNKTSHNPSKSAIINKPKNMPKKCNAPLDISEIKAEVERDLKGGASGDDGDDDTKDACLDDNNQIIKQRKPIADVLKNIELPPKKSKSRDGYVITGVPGLDGLLDQGVPKGSTLLVAGGAGSGKTIMCLQILNYHATHGKKCLYMSFEESKERLENHMRDFGWKTDDLQKKEMLKIQRFNPFDITRSVDALLLKAKGELLIDVDPVILPKGFKPDFVVVDSLSAIASAFTGKEDSYRIYIEQLFLFFEKIGATAFLITETKQIPTIFSTTGVEEFLADGVIVLYAIKKGNIRENAIEVLKLRGASHKKKIVAMQITSKGVVIYPDQEIFTGIEEIELV